MTIEPRWVMKEELDQAFGPWEFCEQVGDIDVWVGQRSVFQVFKNKSGSQMGYKHAVIKFPRIAEKMVAMRSFLWGE